MSEALWKARTEFLLRRMGRKPEIWASTIEAIDSSMQHEGSYPPPCLSHGQQGAVRLSAPLEDQNILRCGCGKVAFRIFIEQPNDRAAMVECDACHEMRNVEVGGGQPDEDTLRAQKIIKDAAARIEATESPRQGDELPALLNAVAMVLICDDSSAEPELRHALGRLHLVKAYAEGRYRTIPDTECLDCGKVKTECADDCPRVRANGGSREARSACPSPGHSEKEK